MPWETIKGPIIVSIIISVALLVGGLLTLGTTGVLFAIPAAPVVELIRGIEPGKLFNGDRAWGMALLLTMIVPPVIPLFLWVGLSWFKANIWWGLLVTVAGVWVWSVSALLWVSGQ